MTARASVPSAVSAVRVAPDLLTFYDRGGTRVASVSCTTSEHVQTLATAFGPFPTVSMGNVLDPLWRDRLATQLRLALYPERKAERTNLVRFLVRVAAAWEGV